MTITTKGQVTIPHHIRERFGLLPHTQVEFVVVGNSVWLQKKAARAGRGPGRVAVEALRGRATAKPRLSTDAIMALTRR
jgi:AbrB family looped-hinge helix DNA binding protein